MPYDTRKVNDHEWETYNPDTGKVYGTHPTEEKAIAQKKLLYAKSPPDKEVKEDDDMTEMSESVPKGAPESDFADPPSGLYVGDAKHAALAVQAVTGGLRGNKAKARNDPGVKSKIAAAIRKFYSGKQQKYYLSWLHTGKKPEEKPTGEMTIHEMISFSIPSVSMPDMPDVPLFPDIDIESIRARDPNPIFVTRPIGVLDGVSENDLVYDEYLLSEIERQVRDKRPPARNGHVPDDAKSWMVPNPVGRWVGVLRLGNVLYGKCYIYRDTPFHEDIQVTDAVGGQQSNSIYGDATLSVGEDGQMKCVGLALESIDFVPPERAALQVLGGEFEVTREMKERETMANDNDSDDKKALSEAEKKAIAEAYLRECDYGKVKEMLSEAQRGDVAKGCMSEMGAEKVYEMLSEAQRDNLAETILGKITPESVAGKIQESSRKVVAESLAKGMGMKLTREEDEEVSEGKIAEMKAAISEMSTLKKQIAELQQVNAAHQLADFNRALDGAIDAKFAHIVIRTDDGKRKINSLKANLRPQVVAEMAGSTKIEDLEAATTRAYEAEAFKPLAEMTIQSLSGPSAMVGVSSGGAAGQNSLGWDDRTRRYSPEAVKAANRITGLVKEG